MKLAAPAIIAACVAKLPTLPAWAAPGDGSRPAVAVYEGAAPRADDVGEWCTVGFVAGDTAADVSIAPMPDAQGQQNRESGAILAQLITAQADVATARARVFDLLADWAGWLVSDRTLVDAATGQGRLLQGSDVHLRAEVSLATTRAGATANAIVSVTYDARTYG